MALFNFERLIENLKGYLETQAEITKIEIKEDLQKAARKVLDLVWGSLLLLFMALFLSIALAVLINEKSDSSYFGFLVMGGFYLVLFVIFQLVKNTPVIKRMFKNSIIEK